MTPLDTGIDGLRQRLLTMASHASSHVRLAMKALVERDDELAVQVEEADNILDALEKEVDEAAIGMLLRGPLARDLRLIMIATRLGHDLERVGDEATAIARRTRALNAEPQLKPYIDLPRMSQMVLDMLNTSIDAFVGANGELARRVIPRDREVDLLNKQLQRELTRYIAENPANIGRCLHLMEISKRLERIGDHAKNIAEEVVFLGEARDIRHTHRPAPERDPRPTP